MPLRYWVVLRVSQEGRNTGDANMYLAQQVHVVAEARCGYPQKPEDDEHPVPVLGVEIVEAVDKHNQKSV